MRLYSLIGASSVHDEEHGSFDVDPDTGAVEVPGGLGARLHGIHVNGLRIWETDAEKAARELDADLARRKDPASLLAAVEKLAEKLHGRHEAPEPDADAVAKAAAEKEAEEAAAKAKADADAAAKKAAGKTTGS